MLRKKAGFSRPLLSSVKNENNLRARIQTIDGLRFLAALGVLWIHTWTVFGNPRFYLGKIDLADFLAIGGNGTGGEVGGRGCLGCG